MKKMFPSLVAAVVVALNFSGPAVAQLAPAGVVFLQSSTRHYIFRSGGTYEKSATFIYLDLATGDTDVINPTVSTTGSISGISAITGRSITGQVSSTTITLNYNGTSVSGAKLSAYGPTRQFAGQWNGFVGDPVAGIGYAQALITSQGQFFVIAALGFNFSEGIGTIDSSGHFSASLTNGLSISGTFAPFDGVALGNYTLSSGATNSYGVVRAVPSRLENISTRGVVGLGEEVLIGGFVVNEEGKTVFIDAKGPSLAAAGVANPVQATQITLYSGSQLIASNNGWQNNSNVGEIQASGLAPTDARESALQVALEPGAYTAIVSSGDGSTGVGLVEIFGVGDTEGP
jgi:hypothetical protein